MRMKTIGSLACLLLFVSAAASAQAPSPTPLSREALFAILGTPASSECAVAPSQERFDLPRSGAQPKSACSSTAHCTIGTVSCSGSSTCTAVDVNCAAGEPGHVTCDGVTSNCPACPACGSCCQCNQTGDCFACCRCGGGGPGMCFAMCNGM